MANFLQKILKVVADKFSTDASGMLIWTGVAGWGLSSLAQICGIAFNKKIPKEQKSFLIPQEIADAAVNVGTFFLITQSVKWSVSKLFQTGKFAPEAVRKYLQKNKDLYADKIGKLDFSLDKVLKKNKDFPKDEYYACKNFYTTVATVGAGVLSSNIITPLIRNYSASKMQKTYLNKTNSPEAVKPYKPSSGMKI